MTANPHASAYTSASDRSYDQGSRKSDTTSSALSAMSEAKEFNRGGYSAKGFGGSSAIDATSSVTSSITAANDDVNEDIMAFYQAKEELLKRRAAGER